MNPATARSGFTLLELLVVLGIITLMAGVLGLALREGDPTRGLESAQASLASLVAAARGQAVLHQNRAMLLIDADPSNDRFLRGVQVAIESAPNSERWWITEHEALLPRGVHLVPGGADIPGVAYAVSGADAGAWPEFRRSSLEIMPPESVSAEADNPGAKYLGMSAPLTAMGRPSAGARVKLVLAVGRRAPEGLIFENPQQVRGLFLSSYGVAVLIHDATGFDF